MVAEEPIPLLATGPRTTTSAHLATTPATSTSAAAAQPTRALRKVMSDTDSIVSVLRELTMHASRAIAKGHWYNPDSSEPGAVEFAMRMFAQRAQKVAKARDNHGQRDFTGVEHDLPRFITQQLFESDSFFVLQRFLPPSRRWLSACSKSRWPLIHAIEKLAERI